MIALRYQSFLYDFNLLLIHQNISNEDNELKKFHLYNMKSVLL